MAGSSDDRDRNSAVQYVLLALLLAATLMAVFDVRAESTRAAPVDGQQDVRQK